MNKTNESQINPFFLELDESLDKTEALLCTIDFADEIVSEPFLNLCSMTSGYSFVADCASLRAVNAFSLT